MFLAYGCRLWIKLFSVCMCGVFFACFYCVWLAFFLKPFRFAGAWQEMSLSNNSSGLAGENPGSAPLRNGGVGLGRLRFQQLHADCLWLRAASSGGCCWLFFFFCLLMLKKLKYTEKWDISIGEDFISYSFCFAYWIVWTVLKLIWIKNKTCFWEKGKKV